MIGVKIKSLRLEKGLQQNVLADRIKIDPSGGKILIIFPSFPH